MPPNKINPRRGAKRSRPAAKMQSESMDLKAKVDQSGGPVGYSLEQRGSNGGDLAREADLSAGLYGRRIAASGNSTVASSARRRLTYSVQGSTMTPNTTHSRYSRFSRTSTSADRPPESPAVHVMCAISENMARMTCVASLDAGSPTTLRVMKQGNGQTYTETLSILQILQPDEILLNEGRKNSQLARKIMDFCNQSSSEVEEAPGDWDERESIQKESRQELRSATVVKFVSRAFFDQTRGADLLRRIARPENYDASVLDEYTLLSSAHAVINYAQHNLGVMFGAGTLFIEVDSGGNNRMTIDRSTILQLELLVNSKTGKTKNSLIGTIDKTKTVVGGRLLRTNLMMPSTRVDTINARLDLVDMFLASEEFFYSVLEHLSRLPDVDKMLSNVALIPRPKRPGEDNDDSVNARMASKGIAALVCIKSVLSSLRSLANALQKQLTLVSPEQSSSPQLAGHEIAHEDATIRTDRTSLMVGLGGGDASTRSEKPHSNHLLKAIIFTLNQPELVEVFQTVSNVLTPMAESNRNAEALRHQECFALKDDGDEDGILSVLRQQYRSNVDDIYKKADEYAEIYGFHVIIRYTTARGYFLAVPADVATDLPSVFIQPSRAGRYIYCSTEEIRSLNIRTKHNVDELLTQTFNKIQKVLAYARERYDALAALCDAIALLDMCHSFADTITLSNDSWCRPLVFDPEQSVSGRSTNEDEDDGEVCGLNTSLVIRKGRFGIEITDPADGSAGRFVPNDTYASDDTRFTLVTGINGSGKSTYLKQLAIIVVLAHCGSYVPAQQASIPLRDRLCTRIGNTDDQESNMSTFMLEMKETAFICNAAGPKSLVLIDELGRATSNEDGVALAWSIAEYLLKKGAMTFFVTHFPTMTRLAEIYPHVQNVHLDALLSSDTREIKYTHRLEPGACKVTTEYGVSLANACGWPQSVVDIASNLEIQIREQLTQGINYDGVSEHKQNQLRAKRILEEMSKSLLSYAQVVNAGSFWELRRDLVSVQEQARPIDNTKLCQMISATLFLASSSSIRSTHYEEENSSISSSPSDDSTSESSSSRGSQ